MRGRETLSGVQEGGTAYDIEGSLQLPTLDLGTLEGLLDLGSDDEGGEQLPLSTDESLRYLSWLLPELLEEGWTRLVGGD